MVYAIIKDNVVENVIVVSEENAPLFGAVWVPDHVAIGDRLMEGEWIKPYQKASREMTFAEIERMLEELRRGANSE